MMCSHRFLAMLAVIYNILPCCASARETLVEVAEIRSLPREQTAKGLPVKLSGVIIYEGWRNFVLHDGKSSIFIDFDFARKKGVWKGSFPDFSQIMAGAEVEIEGITDPGGFSPMVLVSVFRRTGSRPLPAPLRPTMDELLSSSYDSRWVEVEGVVQKFELSNTGPPFMSLMVGGHPCPVLLRTKPGLAREQLVDARIRVRGVMLNIANLRSQTAGMKLHCNGPEDIHVLVHPPTDPFSSLKVPLDRLICYRPDAVFGHRVVSSGVVVFALPGKFLHIMENDLCVRVESTSARVVPGDIVEVAGFIDTTRSLATFSEALIRKIGKETVPQPAEPSVFEILNPKSRSKVEIATEPGHPDFDSRLIRLNGVLRRVLPPDKDGIVTVVVEVESHLVYALLPGTAPDWKEGSTVEITGACELEIDRINELPWFSIKDFHVWLASPHSLRVLSEPPWWTPQRLSMLLAALLLVLLLALVWGYAMRRRVAMRGAQLAAEISARESAQIEHETTLRERQRLANDLHDTLEQSLMGVALQLEIANRSQAGDPVRSAHHMALASQFLERSRREVHRTVWDLRTQGQDGKDFLQILEERVTAMVSGSGIAITLHRQGTAFPMPDLVAGNLMLLAQEAVTNALKHSGASDISIVLCMKPGLLELAIHDNGSGFDLMKAPGQGEGHFGLQGMRERTKRLGGTIEWMTSPGNGTTLRVKVPISGVDQEKS